jgi:hypothetical protein
MKELSEELHTDASHNVLQKCNLAAPEMLTGHVNAYIASILLPQPLQSLEQRVQQRVINVAPQSFCPILQRLSKPPVTRLANNPTAPRKLQTAKQTHKQKT